jgi:hypothetical protein
MTKKSRRRRRRTPAPQLTPAQMVQPNAQVEHTAAPVVKAPRPAAGGLREEYEYVVADLKRIAIIAAVMIVVMIILAVVAV